MDGVQDRRVSYRKLATGTEKIYMAVAAFEALVVFGIAFGAFGLIEGNIKSQGAKARTVPVYLANFILAQIFSLLYVFDALRARNIVQLGLHFIFNICIFVYSILQIPQTQNALDDEPDWACGHFKHCNGPDSLYGLVKKLFIVTPIVLGLCTITFGFLIHRLYIQFGWAVFHLVGASPEIKRYHREYQTLVSLLKLLLFFATAFCIAYLILVTSNTNNTAEFAITIVALPLVPIIMLACGWALRKENRPLMISCLILMVAGLAYFIYKLASMFLPNTAYLYINTKITMAIFSIFAILILLATFAYGVICYSNFGKGLLATHQHPENRTSLWTLGQPKYTEKVRQDSDDEHGVSGSPGVIHEQGKGQVYRPNQFIIE